MTESTIPSLSPYDVGRTPATACRADQRFSYCLYAPKSGAAADRRILVAVHGTERGNQAMRDLFSDLAEALNLIILAPLFPCGIDEPHDRDNYKYIEYRGIRFDLILLSMIEEVAARYAVSADQVAMFGFSGGAHFVHRFFYLHPRKLSALSVCAPGSPTLLDSNRPWWVGVADMEERFGCPLDLPALRAVPVHLAVGDADTDTWEITHKPGGAHWMEGANAAGVTRIERLRALQASLAAAGIEVQMDILPGVRHQRDALAQAAIAFFTKVLGAGAAPC
jgi:poly(3-hydroxybutyrate) depolymerase